MNTQIADFYVQIQNFLMLLTPKERFVVERRFNLDGKERATLEEIGKHYSVTRERIRQIEKNALTKLKRNIYNAPLSEVSNRALEILKASGGVMREDLMIAELLKTSTDYSTESLQLIMSIDHRFKRIPNTVNFTPYLKLNDFDENKLQNMCKLAEQALKKANNTLSVEELKKIIDAKSYNYDQSVVASMLKVYKKLKYVNKDVVGLIEWRHINPRTLRDKIFYVLRNNKSPLHFIEISNNIIESKFDTKKINLQAVHNELIRHNEFVLIGRGIYGLKEWGYQPGTVAQIIESLLRKNDSMSQEEIIQEVLNQRQVKPITVVLSLKNKPQFKRVGRKQYALTG